MKKIFITLMLLSALIAPGILYCQENLLQNGNFEETFDHLPKYWTPDAWKPSTDVTQYFVSQDNPKSGEQYVTIHNIKNNDSRLIQRVQVKPRTTYMMSCWIKADVDSASNIGGNITVIDPEFTGLSHDIKDTAGNWEYVEFYVKTGPKQKEMTVSIRLGGYGNEARGKASFDDFRLVEVKNPGTARVTSIRKNAAPSEPAKDDGTMIIILLIAAVILIGGTSAFLMYNSKSRQSSIGKTFVKSSDQDMRPTELSERSRIKYTKKDLLLAGILTLVYAVVAYANLGSFNVPQSYWRPAMRGESFYVDLGQTRDIKQIYYYEGLPNYHTKGKFRLEYSNDANNWTNLTTIEPKSVFFWFYANTNIDARYIKIIADVPNAMLKEMAIIGPEDRTPYKIEKIYSGEPSYLTQGSPANVFDEPGTVPDRPSMMNGMPTGFDEMYHARTAYEHILLIEPYENTHPPMGKNIIAGGILMFGMNPFGWRFAGTTFGILMVLVMYLFGKQLFKKSEYAFMAAFLMAFDFMHFTQTRIATIDSFSIFFIILMYHFMYKYYKLDFYKTEFKKTLVPLLLCGVFCGLGAATKWLCIYSFAGLAFLFFLTIARRIFDHIDMAKKLKTKEFKELPKEEFKELQFFQNNFAKHIGLTLGWCVLVFIVIPILIYISGYIPFMMIPEPNHDLAAVWRNQESMLNYHSTMTATHPYSSPWYEWPVVWKPMWYHNGIDLPAGKTERIIAMGNPAVWWTGSLAALAVMGIMLAGFIRRIIRIVNDSKTGTSIYNTLRRNFDKITQNNRLGFFILVALASNYIPWVISPRKLTFIYHFFASVPFIILCIVYLIKRFKERLESQNSNQLTLANGVIYFYLAVVLFLFIMFYPVLAGAIVDYSYVKMLKWLPHWPL